jgi:hypothetical protein
MLKRFFSLLTFIFLLLVLGLLLINIPAANSAPVKNLKEYISTNIGGITSINPYYADKTMLKNILNFYYDEYGILNGRAGYQKYVKLPIKEKSNNSFLFNKNFNTKQYIISYDTELYVINSISDSNQINILGDVNTYTHYKRNFFTQNNTLYIGDGYNDVLKFNGVDTYAYIAGQHAPSQDLVLDSVVAVVSDTNFIVGDYKYFYTYYQDIEGFNTVESNGNLNALTVAVDYAAETIILKNILLDTGVRYAYVSEIKIYRTKRNEETFFYLGSITVYDTGAADSYFYDSVNDSDLSLTELTQFNRSVIIPFLHAENYKGRYFLTGNKIYPDRIYFTDISDRGKEPEYINDEYSYITNVDLDGEIITGSKVMNGHLIIFTENKTVSLYIADEDILTPTKWWLTTRSTSIGCISYESIQNIGDGLAFASNQGLYTMGISFIGNYTANSLFDYFGIGIKTDYDNYISRYPYMVKSAYYQHIYYLIYSTNGIYNDKIFVYNVASKKGSFYEGLFIDSILTDIENNFMFGISSLKDGNVWYVNSQSLYDGDNYVSDLRVTEIGQSYISDLDDTYYYYRVNSRLIADTTSVNDTNIIDLFSGIPAYIFDSDSGFFNYSPIVSNDTDLFYTYSQIQSCTVASLIKIGSRNYVIDCVWHDFGTDAEDKIIKYLWADLFSYEGNFGVYLYYDDDLNPTFESISETTTLNHWNDDGLVWGASGLYWGFNTTQNKRKKITLNDYPIFNWFRPEFIHNGYLPPSFNKWRAWWYDKGITWEDVE